MNHRIGLTAKLWATPVLFLALLLVLPVGWNAGAQDARPGNAGRLLLYEVRAADSAAPTWEILLPPGLEYVGLARGSQVEAEPLVSEGGARLTWPGPFAGDLLLRFWVAPASDAEVPASLQVIGLDGEAVLATPEIARPAEVPQGIPRISQADALSITKTVEPLVLEPGDSRWLPVYEVVLDNTGDQIAYVDSMTDTLPSGFLFGGMALGSDVGEPADNEEPDIIWQGLEVPANGTLTLRYHVRASERGGEYTNSVIASSGGEVIGPASSTLEVIGYRITIPVVLRDHQPPAPVWQLLKTAAPTEIPLDAQVTYTVRIANNGDLQGTLSKIEDILPDQFTFVAMAPGSDVTTPPSGTSGTISWSGPWELSPGEDLTLIYTVQSGGGGRLVNTANAYDTRDVLVASGSSTVTIGFGLPFEEDFTDGLSEDWKPFLNWPGLDPGYWSWAGVLGSWGLVNYDYNPDTLPAFSGYNMLIYDAPGAQGWTDYEIEARIKDAKEEDLTVGLTGIWFRGTYDDSGARDGKTVGGYYFYMKQANDTLYLMRTPPDNPTFGSHEVVATYTFSPIIILKHWYKVRIEVEGNHIQIWFEDDEDNISNPVKVFDFTESEGAWSAGTVGLAVYTTASRFDYIYVRPLD